MSWSTIKTMKNTSVELRKIEILRYFCEVVEALEYNYIFYKI